MSDSSPLDRYERQSRFPPLGVAGQQRLAESSALIVGCGALGSMIAGSLARAGVGRLRIVDRDFVEITNLQRQVLFDEEDAAAGLPKAIAAAEKLHRINSQVVVEPIVRDVDHINLAALVTGMQVIVDGTDNFETRFLLNDYSVKHDVPWVYGGCLGSEGQTMTILPGETACLRCLIGEPPAAGSTPTCDTAGIMGPIAHIVASLQATEAIKILSGNLAAVNRALTVIDVWENRVRQVDLSRLRQQVDCPTCRRGEFPWLSGERASQSAVLCGRNAVQLRPAEPTELSLPKLADSLSSLGQVTVTRHLLRFAVEQYVLTIFPDGRAIVAGTEDLSVARSIYARYLGS